ncbi:MAG: SDR family NAD(P)-dependent oxidoreductase, partial [Bacteroidales bacterium]
LFGTPDIVLFNAADFCPGTIDTLHWEDIARANDTNIGGAFNTIKIMLPILEKKKKGTLFFTGGGLALEGNPDYMGLSIGKAGMRNLVQSLHTRLKDSPVRCAMVTVCGFIRPSGKYSPKKIAEIYWNLSQASEEEFKSEIIY